MEQAQRIAAKAVRRVLAGVALGGALEDAGASQSGERALATDLAYGTLRFLGQVRSAVRILAERPLTDQNVEALLPGPDTDDTIAAAHVRQGTHQRHPAYVSASPPKRSRRYRARCGRTLFVSAMVDRSRMRGVCGQRTGNSRCWKRQAAADVARELPRNIARRVSRHLETGERRRKSCRRIRGDRCRTPSRRRSARLCRRLVLGAGCRSAACRAATGCARRYASARCLRRTRRQDNSSRRACETRTDCTRQ